MLKKIKKFKISVNPYFVLRHLKKKIGKDSFADSMEKDVNEVLKDIRSLLDPSAVYETYSRNSIPETVVTLWDGAEKNAISLSLIAVSVGTGLEEEIAKSGAPSAQNLRSAILDAIAREGIEQSYHFITRILAEDAKSEGCEISPVMAVDSKLSGSVLEALEASKAGILISNSGQMTPVYSSAGICFWNPISKKSSRSK